MQKSNESAGKQQKNDNNVDQQSNAGQTMKKSSPEDMSGAQKDQEDEDATNVLGRQKSANNDGAPINPTDSHQRSGLGKRSDDQDDTDQDIKSGSVENKSGHSGSDGSRQGSAGAGKTGHTASGSSQQGGSGTSVGKAAGDAGAGNMSSDKMGSNQKKQDGKDHSGNQNKSGNMKNDNSRGHL